ncbi:MAG: DUF2877 domain-containing protein [Lachnospiraceae bacterium]
MKFSITNIASYATQVLSSNTRGHIHSIYHKTINFQLNGYLLALQTKGSPLSPISLITNLDSIDFQKLGVQSGDFVAITSREVCIYTSNSILHFNYSVSIIFDSQLFPAQSFNYIHLLPSALALSHTGGFRTIFLPNSNSTPSNDQFFITATAKQRILHCSAYISQFDYINAANELVHLIGLGIGLTPSGDDFLCGVLAGLLLSDQFTHPFSIILKEKIRENFQNTNDISGAFLTCALSSHFSKSVKDLPSASCSKEILISFEQIGHSSGMDTLCGIFYGLSLFQ